MTLQVEAAAQPTHHLIHLTALLPGRGLLFGSTASHAAEDGSLSTLFDYLLAALPLSSPS